MSFSGKYTDEREDMIAGYNLIKKNLGWLFHS